MTNGTSTQIANNVAVSTVAPGILTLNGSGLAAADVVQVSATGAQTFQQVYTMDSNGAIIASPIAIANVPAST